MPEMKRSVPIEDIGCVVLEHQQTSITLPLLNALSDNNVAVILCGDNRMPNAMLMNLDSNSTQGESYRAQIEASEPLKKGLWRQVVEAKIRNQAALLESLGREGSILKPYWMNVKSGDADNREGDAPNSMLNYGYSILRAAVARAIMGSGLFPALGIFHRNRYNAFPLADDIMEPYRPFVDRIVYRLYDEGRLEPDKDVKAELLRVLYTDTRFEKTMRPLDIALTFTSSSLAACFAGTRKKIAYPILE